MLRVGLGLLLFGSAVACGSADGSSSTVGSGGQGGAGGTSANAGGTSSIGASGGAAGAGGEALDCSGQVASGELDGESTLTASNDLYAVSSLTNTWQVSNQISDFHAWAWGTTLEPVPSGVAHFRSDAGTHYCSAEAVWSQPYMSAGSGGEITYSRFSKLGSCADISGPTTQLEYCARDSYYQGTAPVECPSGETHVWGMAGTRAVDFSLPGGGGGGSSLGGQWLDYASMFGPGGILVFDAPEGIDGPRRGFLRAELGGAARVLCVQGLVDSSEEHLDRFTLEVVELGTCDAGASVSGEVTACL